MEQDSITDSYRDADPLVWQKVAELKRIGAVEDVIKDYNQISNEPFQFSLALLPHGYGHDFFSAESCIHRACGEALERFVWFHSDSFYLNKTHQNTPHPNDAAYLDIDSIVGFSPEQKQNHPQLTYTPNTQLRWIPTQSLVGQTETYCPLSLFGARYSAEMKEPMLRWPITHGLASHSSYDEAHVRGLLELIEREAFMITYLNKLTPKRIDVEAIAQHSSSVAHVLASVTSANLTTKFVRLVTDFSVHTILCIVIDTHDDGPSYALGSAADFDIETAICRSASEALMVRNAIIATPPDYHISTPFNHFDRIMHWAQKEQRGRLAFLYEGALEPFEATLLQKTKASSTGKLAQLRREFAAHKTEAYSLQLSTPFLEAAGYHVIQTFSPHLQPLHLHESIPCFSGQRLTTVPEKCGFKPAKNINQEPHPYP